MHYRREYVAYYALAVLCLVVLVVARMACDRTTRGDVVVISRGVEQRREVCSTGDTVRLEDNVLRATKANVTASKKRERRVSLFYTDIDSLVARGVERAVCDSIMSYRTAYIIRGSIAEDTLKQATSHTIGALLKPHLGGKKAVYAKREQVAVAVVEREEQTATMAVDLNKATVEELQKVHYVGAKVAGAIVEQRERLGGFVDVSQLRDVYFIRKFDTYDTIAAQVFVEAEVVKKIYINIDDVSTLARHPYAMPLMVSRLTKLRYNDSMFVIRDEGHFRELFGDLKYNPLLEKYLIFDVSKQ